MWSKHKGAIIWCSIILFLLVLPFAYFSAWGQDQVADAVAKNKDKPWAPEWQERVGNTHFYLGRYPEAEKAFANWLKYWPYNPENPGRYPDIHFKWAMALEESPGRRDDAQVAFEQFVETWPEHPKLNDARNAIIRCKNWR